ncbi:MAG: tRNA (N6-threonylcarbamoyladenosine(37)-N6)-methyltransferase TrmO [Deltaproteobacteria bacterium]|nr:tRNA (N6-threonylcarbamoyladenosine(37)-N6)-methyltransferase TrmO [Deltaproteobacteria bacterium]MBW1949548.1 tRNA (N6-threonylcarbamoyladenosine(37)-N6)-methyltransferase TrmO [Deltaproteobacteria bacterium]MBW2007499.1 tRNA (N6-threonylcarbamoyladenosine(37)-N6)-methyltransferase TrmO [Deltaproteobacteria bacterium]
MDTNHPMGPYQVRPVGIIRQEVARTTIEVFDAYADALMGLEDFSHLVLLAWFHGTDTRSRRKILQVHPRGDPRNPLRGVFATRSPARPNPIGMWICRLLKMDGNRLLVEKLDAFDGTPVLDIKPCTEILDPAADVRIPEWAKKGRRT